MKIARIALIAAGLWAQVGCSGSVDVDGVEVGASSAALTGPLVVASMSPTGLIASTGNLYWTQNSFSRLLPYTYTARVYRAAKTNTPGQETILYSETSHSPVSFGNITYAMVDGVWYGYFVATYGTTSQIKRVPLAGGSAVTIGSTSQTISPTSQIFADGTNLYFSDANGLYYLDIRGTSYTHIINATSGIPSFGIDASNVYWASGQDIWKVAKPGVGAFTKINTQAVGNISFISIQPAAGNFPTKVYWATQYTVGYIDNGFPWPMNFTNSSRKITSLSNDGTHSSIPSAACTTTRSAWAGPTGEPPTTSAMSPARSRATPSSSSTSTTTRSSASSTDPTGPGGSRARRASPATDPAGRAACAPRRHASSASRRRSARRAEWRTCATRPPSPSTAAA
jgi:hypothetical protein